MNRHSAAAFCSVYWNTPYALYTPRAHADEISERVSFSSRIQYVLLLLANDNLWQYLLTFLKSTRAVPTKF
jgi:hypothetical protein